MRMAKKKKSNKSKKPLSIEDVIGFQQDILKEWSGKVCPGEEIRDSDLQSISTGSVKLDWALGIPLVEGSFNEIYGDNSTGKSTFALEIAANAIRMGKPVFYFDLERKLRESQLNMIRGLGEEARKLFTRIRPDTGEEAVDMIYRCVTEVPGCLVVFDSITAMLPEVEDAEDAHKQSMGLVARLCWKLVRKVLGPTERNKCILLFISHLTTNLDPYATGDTVKGGKAVGDMSSQRIKLKRLNSQLIKDAQGNIIGQMVICKIIKNNMARPFREVSVPIIYGKGIDRALDLLQLARDLCIIEYTTGWYKLVNEEYPEGKNQRESYMLDYIKTNKEYRESIIRQTKELLED